MAVLTLGTFAFEHDDLPETIPLGGEQMLAVFKYPGGRKEVQVFGAIDSNPSWSGTLNYQNAIEKARVLDRMYRSGDVYPLKIEGLATRYGVIKTFTWPYSNPYSIDYSIEIELAPQTSYLAPQNTTSSGAASPTPSASAPAPQKTYTVQSGDSLWSIAARPDIYGDGSQYRKIATANNISNPDAIFPGQVLKIPS